MNRIIVASLFAVVAMLMAGCTAIPGMQPSVTLPVPLAAKTFSGGLNTLFSPETVDMTTMSEWSTFLTGNSISGYEEAHLIMDVVNTTGSDTDPLEAKIRFLVSDNANLNSVSIDQAATLVTVTLPAGQKAYHYDSGALPLTVAAGQVMQDGHFYVYTMGETASINVRATNVKLKLKFRVSVF